MRKVNMQKYLLQAPGIEMTTKVTKNIPPQNTNLHRGVTHHKPPPAEYASVHEQ